MFYGANCSTSHGRDHGFLTEEALEAVAQPTFAGYGGPVESCASPALGRLHEGQACVRRPRQLGIEATLVHTGQHYDPAMSEIFFDELGLAAGPLPGRRLGHSGGDDSPGRITAFEPLVDRLRPDVVVVSAT